MSVHKSIHLLTESVIEYIDQIDEFFKEVKQSGEKKDFFEVVKPFADEVKVINDQWKLAAMEWIEETRPKNINMKQIESANEQIEMLSVQAFYPDTSKTRFINYIQSVRFILNSILDELKKQKNS